MEEQTKTFYTPPKDGKQRKYVLPEVLYFNGKPCFYDIEFREVKQGEYFISGAIPTAYKAFSDTESGGRKILVAKPTYRARCMQVWGKGEKIN